MRSALLLRPLLLPQLRAEGRARQFDARGALADIGAGLGIAPWQPAAFHWRGVAHAQQLLIDGGGGGAAAGAGAALQLAAKEFGKALGLQDPPEAVTLWRLACAQLGAPPPPLSPFPSPALLTTPIISGSSNSGRALHAGLGQWEAGVRSCSRALETLASSPAAAASSSVERLPAAELEAACLCCRALLHRRSGAPQ
eukprot:COSAG01_NODE_15816_length_1296_cov_21.196324_2_plen_197_part_00